MDEAINTASAPPATPEQLLSSARDEFCARRYNEAARLIEKLYPLQPLNPALWNLAAATARARGLRGEAERHWRTCLTLKPDYAEARSNFGIFLLEDKRYAEAEENLRVALQKMPQTLSVLNNLGVALEGQNRVQEALEFYRRAIAMEPDNAKLNHNLGLQLLALGQFEEGQRYLETAIGLARDKAPYYRSLTISKRFSKGDPHIREMEDLAMQMDSLSARDRMELHFALGKAYADVGEHERSLVQLLAGNAERRRQILYSEADALGQMDLIRRSFTRELISANRGCGHHTRVPIFVLGMPRSGSSLIEQILASHPDVHGAGELQDLRVLAESLLSSDGGLQMPEHVGRLPRAVYEEFGKRYAQRLCAHAPDAKFIVDKRPLNFILVGLIHLALPEARIIHTRRDAVDTCASCFSQLFSGDYPFAYDLKELGRYWRGYDELMAHWRNVLPAEAMLEVQYEELVANPEQQTRQLLQYCGLEWNDACLDFHKTQRAVRTASVLQVRQPIYQRRAHPWRSQEAFMRPLMEGLRGPV